jgi:formylglycine-generating enzyme required for sulfatase activity
MSSIGSRFRPKGSNRVLRGGNWNNNARNCRSANRNNNTPDNRNNNIGFRLARFPAQPAVRMPAC